jgi:hypothetical protein
MLLLLSAGIKKYCVGVASNSIILILFFMKSSQLVSELKEHNMMISEAYSFLLQKGSRLKKM